MTRFLTGSSGKVAADELVLLLLLVDPDADNVVELTTGRSYQAVCIKPATTATILPISSWDKPPDPLETLGLTL